MRLEAIYAALAFSLGALAPAAPCLAQTFVYLGKDAPLYSVTLPDGWQIEVGAPGELEVEVASGRTVPTRLVECSATDRAVWFGLWSIEGVQDLDTAQKISESVESEFVVDPQRVRAPRDFTVAGMKVRTIEGVAKVEDEDEDEDGGAGVNAVRYTTVLFQVSPTAVGVGTYLSEPGGEQDDAKDLAAMIASLRSYAQMLRAPGSFVDDPAK